MKGRLSAAIICIAAAFLMSVGSEMYIVRKCAMLIEGLDKSLCAESGSVEMYDAALEACEEWDGCETLFGSLLKHSDADDLDHAYSLDMEADFFNTLSPESDFKPCLQPYQGICREQRYR